MGIKDVMKHRLETLESLKKEFDLTPESEEELERLKRIFKVKGDTSIS